MEKQNLSVGIVGCGRIAERFVAEAAYVSGVSVAAVYNAREESAARFVRRYGIAFATRDYNAFLKRVDAVYIASPHETHYAYVKRALEAGRHVLCEKPMVYRMQQARELYALAVQNGLVLQEAVKTAYCPGFLRMMETAKSGIIGEITDVEACFTRLTPTNLREFTDIECGGSVTELGSYVLLPVFKLLGTAYSSAAFQSVRAANGVDSYTKISLTYENGMALGKVGLGVKSEGQLVVAGTKGYILCASPWWLTKKFQVRFEDSNRIEEYTAPFEGAGLRYELAAFLEEIAGCKAYGDSDSLHGCEERVERVTVGFTSEESIAAADVMERFLMQEKRFRHGTTEEERKAVRIWAHRGCSMAYPENTLKAFAAAAQLDGLEGIEFDVQLSKDGEIMVFHDETLDRVTDATGRLTDYTLPELRSFSVAPGTKQTAKIPTLEETLALLAPYCRQTGLRLNIELKTSVIHYEEIEEKTYACVERFGLTSYVVYSSFWEPSVRRMKEMDPTVETGMLSSYLSDCIEKGKSAHANALHPSIAGLDCRIPGYWKGRPVRAWNSEEPFFGDGRVLKEFDLRRYRAFGVTDIFTNVPERYLGREEG